MEGLFRRLQVWGRLGGTLERRWLLAKCWLRGSPSPSSTPAVPAASLANLHLLCLP